MVIHPVVLSLFMGFGGSFHMKFKIMFSITVIAVLEFLWGLH